jgi:arylsulfatase
MHPYRAGMVLPQLPGAISYLRPGHTVPGEVHARPRIQHRRVRQEPPRRPPRLAATAHGFQEFWGYLYHLDAMQQVSFPDINSSPDKQAVVPP